jgi:hypothetical protein
MGMLLSETITTANALSLPSLAASSLISAKAGVLQSAAFVTGTWTGLLMWTIASMVLYTGLKH